MVDISNTLELPPVIDPSRESYTQDGSPFASSSIHNILGAWYPSILVALSVEKPTIYHSGAMWTVSGEDVVLPITAPGHRL